MELKPTVVRTAKARELLGGIGETKLYELINAGEIESFLMDTLRLFDVASIEAFLARKRAQGVTSKKHVEPARRRRAAANPAPHDRAA